MKSIQTPLCSTTLELSFTGSSRLAKLDGLFTGMLISLDLILRQFRARSSIQLPANQTVSDYAYLAGFRFSPAV